MAVTYTGNLKLGLPTTGTESGTWGDVVNNQITTLVDQSISGTVSLTSMTNADYTLTNGNGNAANEARYMALLVPSSLTLTAARNIIVPSTSKMYVVKNATTGGFSVTVKTSAGTGVEVPNGNEMLLYCDGTNVVVAFDTINVNSVNGGPLAGLRNRVINGSMAIDQRNSGVSVTPSNGAYTLDRWVSVLTVASKYSVQQSSIAPNGFPKAFAATSLSAYAVTAGDAFAVASSLEGFNILDLVWGTASAKTVTLSFWTRSSLTGTFGGVVRNGAANRSYPFTYTITAANTWEYKSIVIPGDTTGTWAADNTAGLQILFSLGAGTTVSGTAGVWAGASYTSAAGAVSVVGTNAATWYMTGVQLELGSVATPFEQRPYGMELALCQRYYEKAVASQYISYTSGNVDSILTGNWAVVKRTTPSSMTVDSSIVTLVLINNTAALGAVGWIAGITGTGATGAVHAATIVGSAEL